MDRAPDRGDAVFGEEQHGHAPLLKEIDQTTHEGVDGRDIARDFPRWRALSL